MMGANAGELEQRILDDIMPNLIKVKSGSKTRLHLMYSKEEHTYNEHIADLIYDLEKNGIIHTDTITHFKEHSEVGLYFSPWIKNELKIK